jgi:hypothetical protein
LFLGTATGANDALPFASAADPSDFIIASDIDADYLARLASVANTRGLKNVVPRRIDIQTDLDELGHFDVVTLFFVIHRCNDWERVVRRLPALVSPAGSLYLSEFVGPSGMIYLSNEGGGRSDDVVSRMIRRYFELLPESFDPPLKSTRIGPAREVLAASLPSAGYRDFCWPQRLTVGEVYQRIRTKAYAPYFNTRPSDQLLTQLKHEFESDWLRELFLTETIRIYRFGRPDSHPQTTR